MLKFKLLVCSESISKMNGGLMHTSFFRTEKTIILIKKNNKEEALNLIDRIKKEMI